MQGPLWLKPPLAESLYYVIKPERVPEEQEEVAGTVPAVDDEFLRDAMDAEIEGATQAYYADSPPPERAICGGHRGVRCRVSVLPDVATRASGRWTCGMAMGCGSCTPLPPDGKD